MPTDTFLANYDGHVNTSFESVYANARQNTGSGTTVNDLGVTITVGQQLSGFYSCYEAFLAFDTSSIPDGDVITNVVLSIYGSADGSTTDFTVNAKFHTFTNPLTTSSFVKGSDMASDTLFATLSSSGYSTAGYNAFTSTGGSLSGINKTGTTYVALYSNNQ